MVSVEASSVSCRDRRRGPADERGVGQDCLEASDRCQEPFPIGKLVDHMDLLALLPCRGFVGARTRRDVGVTRVADCQPPAIRSGTGRASTRLDSLVEGNPHLGIAAAPVRCFADSRTPIACSRVTVGNWRRNSSSVSPASKYSNIASTGTRVPAKTVAPHARSRDRVTKGFVLAIMSPRSTPAVASLDA